MAKGFHLSTSFIFMLGSVAAFPPLASAAPVWSDPLTGSEIDLTRWTTSTTSTDLKMTTTSEGVLMSLAGTARGTTFGAGITGLCAVEGDFDIQIDYQLVVWPSRSGVRTGLEVVTQSGFAAIVERDSLAATDVPVQTPGSEVYLTDFQPHSGAFLDVPTSDMQGTLRLNRSGGSVSAYFASPGKSWTIVGSTAAPSEPVTVVILMWSGDNVFNKQSGGAQARFRNFVVNSGQLSCPDGGVVGLDGSPSAAEAGSAVEAGHVSEAGTAAEAGQVLDASQSVDAAHGVDTGNSGDAGSPADGSVSDSNPAATKDGSVADSNPAAARDAGGGDVATMRILGRSGCGCFVGGGEPFGSRLPFLFISALCLAALARRRHR